MYAEYDIYNQSQTLAGAIWRAANVPPPAEPPPPLLQLRTGRAESPGWFLVQATEFDPQPVTVAGLRRRDVYASDRLVAALLELMASEKWLEPVPPDAFALTESGRALTAARRDRLRTAVAAIADPLPAGQLQALERRLRSMIDAWLDDANPHDAWSLRLSRRRAPGDDAPALVKLMQYSADFNAYRDDAHMAAFQPSGVSGQAWEALTLIWQGQAETAVAIDQQLHFRGYSAAEYAAALDALAQRGWLVAAPGHAYTLTADGRAVREAAETRTNDIFYAPLGAAGPSAARALSEGMATLQTALAATG